MNRFTRLTRTTARLAVPALLLAAGAAEASYPATPSSAPLASPGSPSMVPSSEMPGPLKQVGYDQRIGARIPLELPFKDEAGRPVKLGDAFGRRPVLLVLAYYHCPMLCDMVLQGVETSLKPLSLDPGKDFEVVVASIDPAETPGMAKAKRDAILTRYGRPGTEGGWHFLTGPAPSIERLASAVGFRYVYDAQRNQFAHAAGVVFATPDGRVSRYLLGVEYPAKDVRLALAEAGGGKLGSVVDQVLLYCFHYDPAVGRYSVVTMNIVRLGAIATVLGIILLIALLRRRETAGPGPLGAART